MTTATSERELERALDAEGMTLEPSELDRLATEFGFETVAEAIPAAADAWRDAFAEFQRGRRRRYPIFGAILRHTCGGAVPSHDAASEATERASWMRAYAEARQDPGRRLALATANLAAAGAVAVARPDLDAAGVAFLARRAMPLRADLTAAAVIARAMAAASER